MQQRRGHRDGRQRARSYVFTWNNYTEDTKEYLRSLVFKYLIFGEEVAPTTGTKHLQGYIMFANPKEFSTTRELLSGAHVEIAKGSTEDNIVYVSKSGQVTEIGSRPGNTTARHDWPHVLECAKTGAFDDIEPELYIKYFHQIHSIHKARMTYTVEKLAGPCGYWFYGKSGAGKTGYVLQHKPHAFMKTKNKWWDKYRDEDTVLIDDVDNGDTHLGPYLKQWAHEYPFNAEIKHKDPILIRPKYCVVTSQYFIQQIWTDAETIDALTRRFTIVYFTHDNYKDNHDNCNVFK